MMLVVVIVMVFHIIVICFLNTNLADSCLPAYDSHNK